MTDNERAWLRGATNWGGGFVSAFAWAVFKADDSNFAILHSALVAMMAKYPDYLDKGREHDHA